MLLIGIDPGVNTGMAIGRDGKLESIVTGLACEIEMQVKFHSDVEDIFVYFEDARMRQWFGKAGREKLQGAGSVKRDCQRWQEWLEMNNIPHCKVAPKDNKTKLNADQFSRITKWEGRTNEHGRDAAMLIFGRKLSMKDNGA